MPARIRLAPAQVSAGFDTNNTFHDLVTDGVCSTGGGGAASFRPVPGIHRAGAVYLYVKLRQVRGVYATIGRAGAGRPIISSASNRKQGRTTLPVKVFTVGVDEAKGILYARLKEQTPGPGYCHFLEGEGYDEEYFKQLTAEKRVIRYQKGFPKAEWIKTRARNEALDCRVQAHAALCLLNPLWGAVEKRLAPRLPFPEQAIVEPVPSGHPFGVAAEVNGSGIRRVKARDPYIERWRR